MERSSKCEAVSVFTAVSLGCDDATEEGFAGGLGWQKGRDGKGEKEVKI